MCRFILLYLSLFFLTNFKSLAQDPPIEWGEIPVEDLKMSSFPADSNASAVILCDYGETKLNDDLDLIFTRHLRIKILNQNGYDWGTHSIYLYTGKHGEHLDDLEAITYSLNPEGEITETELDDDEIFEEEVTEERTKFNFTMPALTPGCILEIKYIIIARSLWLIKNWTFQKDEPVLWSEYRIRYPKNIGYALVTLGYEPWEIKEHTEEPQIFRGVASTYVGNIANCHQHRLAVKNVPALRDEPYTTTIDDYANKVAIQLSGYSFYQVGVKKVLQDWKTLTNELLDLKSFGNMIDVTGDVEDLTAEITKGLKSSEEKLIAVYNWIINSIVWTGEETIYSDYDPDKVIEYKKGNSADITFLLLSMMKSIGINGEPVILSTRSNGKIQELYPIVDQFDYVIAKINSGSSAYYVDATDPFRNFDILPEKVLNCKGLIVKKDNPGWIVLISKKNNQDKSIINVNINDDGTLKADFEKQYGEYKSIGIRKGLGSKTDSETAKDLFKTESNVFTLDSSRIFAKDSINVPFKIKSWITADNYTQQGGDFIYFNPVMINRLTDNPFKAKERKFPIDFGYPHGSIIITNITLPEGYEIKEKFPNRSFDVENIAAYKRVVQINGNMIQIMSKMDIKVTEVKPKFYKQLKDFYSRVIESHAEMIVIGKLKEQTNSPGTETGNIK